MENNITMAQHAYLLQKLPRAFFVSHPRLFDSLNNPNRKNQFSQKNIAKLYFDLYEGMKPKYLSHTITRNEDNWSCAYKSKKQIRTSFNFFDTTIHDYNSEYIPTCQVPKLYNNVFDNYHSDEKKSLSVDIVIKPKNKRYAFEVRRLLQEFKISAYSASQIQTKHYSKELTIFLNRCYESLKSLLEIATAKPGIPFSQKGSCILSDELITFLKNQDIFLSGQYAKKCAFDTRKRKAVVKGIILRKEAMFGELTHKNIKSR